MLKQSSVMLGSVLLLGLPLVAIAQAPVEKMLRNAEWQVASSVLASGATQTVGTVECQGIRRGSPVNTNPIQKATLELRAGGYTLRFTEMVQGQPRERVWNLNNRLLIEDLRSYNPDDRTTPVKIQSTGAFSKTIMPSSREECTFAGTLQFVGNAQAQLFSSSSEIAILPNSLEPTASPSQSETSTPQDFKDSPLTSLISHPYKCSSYHFNDLRRMKVGETLTCKCRPGNPTGHVEGTDVYGDNSEICLSAIHAGKIEKMPDGATITIEIVPNQYTKGTKRHGIASDSSYPKPQGKSFVFKEVLLDIPSRKLQEARKFANQLNTLYPYWNSSIALPNCPCTLEDVRRDSKFINFTTSETKELHPGAEFDYRTMPWAVKPYRSPVVSEAPELMPGQQCTYAKASDGIVRLITGGVAAGTPDTFAPTVSVVKHNLFDVQPFKADGMTWQEYQETWKPNNGGNASFCRNHIVPEDPKAPIYPL